MLFMNTVYVLGIGYIRYTTIGTLQTCFAQEPFLKFFSFFPFRGLAESIRKAALYSKCQEGPDWSSHEVGRARIC